MNAQAHAQRVARDMEIMGLPATNWPAAVSGPDGRQMADVLVVGAGVFGLAAAGALAVKGIRNVVLLDRAERGQEGIWTTTARMKTLRSRKDLPGLAFGIPSLAFRAWYEARKGEAAWEALGKIPNEDWQEYLVWIQSMIALDVRNGVEVACVRPGGGLLEVDTNQGSLYARRVVLATGRARPEALAIPGCVDRALWPDLAAHSGEAIDMAALSGRRVAVIGGAASAWDNAAAAVEHGAESVDLYIRRPALPQVNKWVPFFSPGLFHGWPGFPPETRWELMRYMLRDWPPPPPRESVLRALAHATLSVHLGSPVLSARRKGGGVEVEIGGTSPRRCAADFLVVATGFGLALSSQPELAELQGRVATWGDVLAPPPGQEDAELAGAAWLGAGFELVPRPAEECPDAARVHVFNHAAFASMGGLASEIPAIGVGAERLSSRIAEALACEDAAHLRTMLDGHQRQDLDGTPFHVPAPRP